MNFITKTIPRRIPKTLLFFIVLFFALLATHKNLVFNGPFAEYDDQIVVKPMESVNTFSDYLLKIHNGQIVDRQPVRDLSFWIDYQIQKKFKVSIFHFHNILIWFGITILFFYILIYEKVSYLTTAFAASLYAFHPSLTTAVSWISARKHLLSAFCILVSTLLYIRIFKSKKEPSKPSYFLVLIISFFYFLSCFSQPINLMWPLWAVCYYIFYKRDLGDSLKWILLKDPTRKRFILIFSLLLVISLLTFFVNYHYYAYSYVSNFGVAKFQGANDSDLSFKILSLGASFFQIICPIWPTPSSYYPGSNRNMVGMILLVLFVFGIFKMLKKGKRQRLWGWAIFAILPLLVTLIKMTNILGSDTYLIIPVVGVYIIIANLVTLNRWTYILLSGLIVFFIITSNEVSNSWMSGMKLWTLAYKNEESPPVLRNLANAYYLEKQYQTSFELAVKLWAWNKDLYHADLIYARSIHALSSISHEKKIYLMEEALKTAPKSSWLHYFLSRIYSDQKNWQKAFLNLKGYLIEDIKFFPNAIAETTAEMNYICLKANNMDTNQCKIITERVRSHYRKEWNEIQYNKKLTELLK